MPITIQAWLFAALRGSTQSPRSTTLAFPHRCGIVTPMNAPTPESLLRAACVQIDRVDAEALLIHALRRDRAWRPIAGLCEAPYRVNRP